MAVHVYSDVVMMTNVQLNSQFSSSSMSQLKSVGPKLVPFFKTAAIYFVLFLPSGVPSWTGAFVKCLPVLCLLGFVLMHGISLGHQHVFSRRILTGLALSCVGDVLLVWPAYFVHGMAFFGVAQLMYTAAFGFKPLNAPLGAVLYAATILAVWVLVPGLQASQQSALLVGLPFYCLLLTTMAWRAIARVQFFEELWTWTKLCSCVGGIFFVISDGLIGFDRFYTSIPHSQALIMTTYYAAQLGIALSVVDSRPEKDDNLTAEEEEENLESLGSSVDASTPRLAPRRRHLVAQQ